MRVLHYTILVLTSAWAIGWIVFAAYSTDPAKSGEEQFAFWFYVNVGVWPLVLYLVVALYIWLSIRLEMRRRERTPRSRH